MKEHQRKTEINFIDFHVFFLNTTCSFSYKIHMGTPGSNAKQNKQNVYKECILSLTCFAASTFGLRRYRVLHFIELLNIYIHMGSPESVHNEEHLGKESFTIPNRIFFLMLGRKLFGLNLLPCLKFVHFPTPFAQLVSSHEGAKRRYR